MFRTTAAAVISAAFVMGSVLQAGAQEKKLRFNLASAFPGNLTIVGEAAPKLVKRILVASGGQIEIKFNEPGALVPALQAVEAVSPRLD